LIIVENGRRSSARLNLTVVAAAAVLLLLFGLGATAQTNPIVKLDDAYDGNYRAADGHMIGIDRFMNDAGNPVELFSDYQSRIVRQLFPLSDSEFVKGHGFDVHSPAELTVRFVRDLSKRQPSVDGNAFPKQNGSRSL